MAWIDDRIWCHPKVLRASKSARWTYVAGVAYSSGFGLAGHLEPGHLQAIGSDAKTRRELVAVGLWDDLGKSGIAIHDWAEHNGKRDARKAADRERKRNEYWSQKGQEPPQETPQENSAENARRNPGENEGVARVEARAGARPMTGEGSEEELLGAVPELDHPPARPEPTEQPPDFTKEEEPDFTLADYDLEPNLREIA